MKIKTENLLTEVKQTLHLALPLIVVLLAQMGTSLIDTFMMGRLGPTALAAGVLAGSVFIFIFVLCSGLLSAIGIFVAQFYGEQDFHKITCTLHQGLYLALILSLPYVLILFFTPAFLLLIKQDQQIVFIAKDYLYALMFKVPALLFFLVFRGFSNALSHQRLVMIITIIALPFNAVLDYVFMYGEFGFPRLGIAGIGYANTFMQWIVLLVLILYINKIKLLKTCSGFSRLNKIDLIKIKEIVSVGLPIGIATAFEMAMFSASTLMMGYFGFQALAAHQIALQCVNFAFVFHLGISQACTLRISKFLGEKNFDKVKYTAYVSIVIGLTVAIFVALAFFFLPNLIISAFIDTHLAQNRSVVVWATSYLAIAVVFELLDSVQATTSGALRGLKDTFIPMLIGVVTYCLVGVIAIGYFAFWMKMGGVGIWWGLGLGVGVSGFCLSFRFFHMIKKHAGSMLQFNNTLVGLEQKAV